MSFSALHNPGAPIDLAIGGLSLTAFSISGVSTYVLVPAFDACFDLGHCAMEATRLRNVFLTHVHQDHAGGVHRHHSVRRMFGASPSRIFVPAENAQALGELFQAWDRLEQKQPDPPQITGVAAGQEISLGGKHCVRAFDVIHRIASRGYTVIERRQKLRPEYAGLEGAEIHAARLAGATVSDPVEIPVFTFIGDSTIETLRRNPGVGASGVLFLEATHVGETSPEVSAKYGHTHLDELVALWGERPEIFGEAKIVLKHFSTRYSLGQIEEAVRKLPAGFRERVTVLI